MHTYTDYFDCILAHNAFFAGANTMGGFVGEYKNLFCEDDLDKVYMIKGGSGTGKSTLIRYCAKKAEDHGFYVTYLYCSSDPESLDGIIIDNKGRMAAIIDSTAPHTIDPDLPGAVGEIVNCGNHWVSDKLYARRREISDMIKEKKRCYERAYRFIRAQWEIGQMQKKLAEGYTYKEKEKAAIRRICGELPMGEGKGKDISRRTYCFSMKGAYRLTTFEDQKRLIAVRDSANLSTMFFERLTDTLLEKGHTVYVSEYPFGGIGEICLPELSLAFVPYREGVRYERIINLRRFTDPEGMGRVKQKRQFLSKCMESMLVGTKEALLDAGKVHFSLEGIYREAMDFSGIDDMGRNMWAEIEKRLTKG